MKKIHLLYLVLLSMALLTTHSNKVLGQGFLGRKLLIAYKPAFTPFPNSVTRNGGDISSWVNHSIELEYIRHRLVSIGGEVIYNNYSFENYQGGAVGGAIFIRKHGRRGINPIGNYFKFALNIYSAYSKHIITPDGLGYSYVDEASGIVIIPAVSFGKRIPLSQRLLFDYAINCPIPLFGGFSDHFRSTYVRTINIQLGLTFAAK